MERSITNVKRSDRVRNVDVSEKTDEKYCRYLAKQLKMDYASPSHVARREIGGKEQ